MDQPHRSVPDTPLTDPRSLVSSLAFHGVLLFLASLVLLRAVAPEDTPEPRVLRAELAPVENRAPGPEGGGGPGELGGLGPPVAVLPPEPEPSPAGDEAPPPPTPPDATAGLDSPPATGPPEPAGRGVGVVPGPGLGGGGGSGGGSGGGIGRGVGSSTEFFGAHETAHSFVYVIDRSGSMSQRHAIDLAKRELLASLEKLPEGAAFAVLFYNNRVERVDGAGAGLIPATAGNRGRIRTRLEGLRATGGTDHVAALRAAFATGAEVVFFLTDARWMSPEDSETLRSEAGSSRVQAVMFGVGPDPGTTDPLEALAVATGGSYRYIDVLSRPPARAD